VDFLFGRLKGVDYYTYILIPRSMAVASCALLFSRKELTSSKTLELDGASLTLFLAVKQVSFIFLNVCS